MANPNEPSPLKLTAPRPELNQRRPQRGRAGPGRPKGSKNKPRAHKEVEAQLRATIGDYLPKEDLEYLLGSLAGTQGREFDKDMLILLSLQLKALLPVLADEIKQGRLSPEATRRSSTVKELLALWLAKQKQEKGNDDPTYNTFIQNILVNRGIDQGALDRLIGPGELTPVEQRLLPGSPDIDEGPADEAGTLPVEVLTGSE